MNCAVLTLLLALTAAAPDTLVICPSEFRSALAPWEEYRRQQGHEILVLPPCDRPEQLGATIAHVAQAGTLKYLLLIGDVPGTATNAAQRQLTVPTYYMPASVNTRWGSEPTIASDMPYADLDRDGMPDLAIGRIPADNPDELAAVVRKIVHYERAPRGDNDRRLNVVSGAGGFGALTDAIVEAAATQVMRQTVPNGFEVQRISVNPTSADCPPADELRPCVCRQLSDGGFAWIYIGHGLPTHLDCVPAAAGGLPLLSVDDVSTLKCEHSRPLAVLVACYTGAIDANRDCLAEELVLAENGPIAVVAATRVTMPYGNTVLGYELLRACFHDRLATLGDVLRLAQSRTLGSPADDPLRPSLDKLARGISPPPVDLAAERREHAAMYHLLGDPLLRMRHPAKEVADLSTSANEGIAR
jgi:hypothetical protein